MYEKKCNYKETHKHVFIDERNNYMF